MKHNTARDSANRLGNGLSRAVLEQTDDAHLMQEVDVSLFHDEKHQGIEHFHQYGFFSRPKKPTMQGGIRRAAEAIFAFLGNNRTHGIAMLIGDRRFRPNNVKEGETGIHDDQGQQVYISRDRVVVNSHKEVHVQRGKAHGIFTDDKVKIQLGDLSVTVKGGKVLLGSESASHAVVTVDGPSEKVFAVISESDREAPEAQVAKRTEPQAKK